MGFVLRAKLAKQTPQTHRFLQKIQCSTHFHRITKGTPVGVPFDQGALGRDYSSEGRSGSSEPASSGKISAAGISGSAYSAQSGIGKDIKIKGEVVQGSPAFSYLPYQKSYAIFRNLPALRNQILDMEKEISELKKKIGDE